MIAMVRTVRGVKVHRQVRVPLVEKLKQPPGFRSLDLHKIAVQIQALAVLTHANPANRTILLSSICQADTLVAIGVVDRRHQHNHFAEKVAQVPAGQPLGNLLACFFAFDFPPSMRKEFNGDDRFFPITYKDAWKVVREIAEGSGTPYNKAAFEAEAKREAEALAKKQQEQAAPKQ